MQYLSKIAAFKKELDDELINILNYWINYTIDDVNGGFYGKLDNQNHLYAEVAKGSVLNARILWSFAAAYNFTNKREYLETAKRAYEYIIKHFIDDEFGGVYWSVNYKGERLDTKKQVYAIAFTIYGMSEYYLASGAISAKDTAIKLYRVLVDNCYDKVKTGYFEAFTRDWGLMEDLRLSAKDANEKKTMNTHLHVLEAYTNLYKIWPDESLKDQIKTLLNNFTGYIIDQRTNTLNLFFDEDWNTRSTLVSYGHDIEASWLLLDSAEVTGDHALVKKFKEIALVLAKQATSGLDTDGSLWYEFEPEYNHLNREKHWWVQAEAMVGFFNAWQINNNNHYLDITLIIWRFIKTKILNKEYGEWYWGINSEGDIMVDEDKVGIWKCPYHNSRACIEIIKRIRYKMEV